MGLVKVLIGPILLYHMWCGGLYHVPLDMFYKEYAILFSTNGDIPIKVCQVCVTQMWFAATLRSGHELVKMCRRLYSLRY